MSFPSTPPKKNCSNCGNAENCGKQIWMRCKDPSLEGWVEQLPERRGGLLSDSVVSGTPMTDPAEIQAVHNRLAAKGITVAHVDAGLEVEHDEGTPKINKRDVDSLFIKLWDKAVGTPDYDKSEWKTMQSYLYHIIYGEGCLLIEGESTVRRNKL